MYFYDQADNFVLYQWTFSLADIDEPTLLVEPMDLVLYEHNITEIIRPFWSVYDLDSQPGTYTININGNTVLSGEWTTGNGIIYVPMDSLTAGTYHYDAYFRDASGNTEYTELDITVLDIIKPIVMSIGEIYSEPLYKPDWFEFQIVELHPSHYSLYRNGSFLSDVSLSTDFSFVLVQLTNMSTGNYNFTLVVEDESGNIGALSIRVQVGDYTPPLILPPPDMIVPENTDESIVWEINEVNPYNYTLYHNGALYEEDTLTASSISLSLASLALGVHTFTLLVFDQYGFSHTCTSTVTIVDITPPTCSHLGDCEFLAGDEYANLFWKASDLHPASYLISVNDVDNPIQAWDGNDIVLPLLGWVNGTYAVKITVFDTSGNLATDEVVVTLFTESRTYKVPKVSPWFGYVCLIALITLVPVFRKIKKK